MGTIEETINSVVNHALEPQRSEEGAVGGDPAQDQELDDIQGEWQIVTGNQKSSPSFVVEEMSTPALKRFAKERNMNARTRILPSGKQLVSVPYEKRGEVESWLKVNSTGGNTHSSNEDRPGTTKVKGIHRDYEKEEVIAILEE